LFQVTEKIKKETSQKSALSPSAKAKVNLSEYAANDDDVCYLLSN
jgi:hypothetical protein